MAAGTRVGTGYVEISPDFSGFQREVERALASRFSGIGAEAGKKLSDGISRSVRSRRDGFGLASALAPLVRKFEKAGDDAGRKLADRIGKGAGRARNDMFGLADALGAVERQSSKAGRSAKVFERDMFGVARAADDAGRNVRASRSQLRDWATGARGSSAAARGLGDRLRGASTRLREVTAGTRAAAGGFGGMNGAMARVNRGAQFFRNVTRLLRFPALVTGLGLATQGLAALAAGFTAAASSVGPLAGALVALPAAVATAAQAFGALKLATAGIGDTIKAALDAQIKGGSQAATVMGQQTAAADRVADAEMAVADAQRQTKIAQDDLTAARKEARRELEDMALAAERSGTSEEAAVLQLRQLRRELLQTALDPESTELDIRMDENALKQAQFDLKQTRIEAKRTRADYRDAADEGVKGMPAIVAARRAEAEASRAETAAQRDLQRAVEASTETMAAQGAAATNLQEEMSQLPPAAQAFVRQVIAMKPRLDELRATAASGLFPGVSTGLRGLMGNFGVVKGLVGDTASAFGGLAARAGKALGGTAWGRDLKLIGDQNVRSINQMGRAGGNLADAFRHILVAARPFVNWLGKGTVALTGWIKTEAEAGRKSGRLAAFFERTKQTMKLLGPILKGVGGAFLNIGKAARPLGNDILRALGRAAERFRQWTGSVEGQNSLRNYFADAKPAIFETGKLIAAIGKAFVELGSQPGAAPLIRQVRTELLPALTDAIGTITKHFGPAFVDAVTAGIKLLQTLSHESGPLVVVAKALGGVAKALRWVVEHVPAAETLVTAFLALKAVSFASTILGVQKLARLVTGLAGTFRAAGTALGVSLGSGVSAGAATAAGGSAAGGGLLGAIRGKVLPLAKRAGLAGVGIALADGVIGEFGRRSRERSSDLLESIRAQAEGGKLFGFDTAKLPGGAGLHLHENERAARTLLPILTQLGQKRTVLSRAEVADFAAKAKNLTLTKQMRSEVDGIIASLRAGSNLKVGVDLDMDPAKLQKLDAGMQFLRSGWAASMGDITKVTRRNMAIIRNTIGMNTAEGRKAAGNNLRAMATAFRVQMQGTGKWTKEAMQRHRQIIRKADLVSPTKAKATEFGREWAKGMNTSTEITRRGFREMIREARKMPAPMRKVALESWLAQIREARRSNTITKGEFRKLRSNALAEFSGLAIGQKRKSKQGADDVLGNVARMVTQTGKGFGVLVSNANQALVAFGADRLTYEAKKWHGGEQKKQAGGFIVPGSGTGDKVRTALPAGSFVLNRKATEAFGFQRGGLAPVALEPGERVFHPDEVRRHGPAIEAMNRAVPRFQTGGMVRVPGDPIGPFSDTVNRSVAGLAADFVKKFKLNISAAFNPDGGHKSPGHNVTGTAIDIIPGPGGSWDLVGDAVAAAVARGLTVYYDGSRGSTALEDHGPGNHAHIELGSAGPGASIPLFEKLAKVALLGSPGPLRDMGQGALDKVRRAGDRMLAKKAMVTGAGDPFSGIGGGEAGYATRAQMVAWATEALHRTGHGASPEAIEKILTLARKESGWELRSLNDWDINWQQGNPSGGLMHVTLDKVGGSYERLYDPVENMMASIRYQFERYGGLITHSPYAKGGLVRMVGDSLGVGTVGLGGLGSKIKGLSADVLGGRFAAGSAGLFGKGFKQYIFDLGTNDTSASAPASVLRAVDRLTGDAPIHALTLNGPLAAEKNAKLQGAQGGDINLLPWAARSRGLLEPDGFHATGAGYGKRASMIADSVRKAADKLKREKRTDNQRKRAGRKKDSPEVVDVSQTAIGSASKAIKQAMKLVRNPNAKKRVRSKQVNKLVDRLKAQFDLPGGWRNDLAFYEAEEAKTLDRAGRADEQTFDVMDAEGEPVVDAEGRQVVSLGQMDGRTAEDWTRARLKNLIEWRNKLIRARIEVMRLKALVEDQIKQRQRRVDELTGSIARRFKLKGHLDDLFAWVRRPKINDKKISGALREVRQLVPREMFTRIKRAVEERNRPWLKDRFQAVTRTWRADRRERSALTGHVIPALVDRRDALGGDRGEFETKLGEIQGPGYGMELSDLFSGLPQLRQFSGSIFDAHSDLSRFSEKPPLVQRDTAPQDDRDDSERIQFLSEQLTFANQRSLLKDSQFKTLLQYRLGDGIPFAGTFHEGGVVPGPKGAERMALVQAGEKITPLRESESGPFAPPIVNVHVHVDKDAGVDPNKIRSVVKQEMRGAGRGARRVLGGV
ncbi:MAG TPA: hypothetical protein VHF88_07685 [Thermoleophilaceae bacterium]|nr:hypothetical protein [Thermoleophilaceae bacterium]